MTEIKEQDSSLRRLPRHSTRRIILLGGLALVLLGPLLFALNLRRQGDAMIAWSFELPERFVWAEPLPSGEVLLATETDRVLLLDRGGDLVASKKIEADLYTWASCADAEGNVYFGADEARLFKMSRDTEVVWERQLPQPETGREIGFNAAIPRLSANGRICATVPTGAIAVYSAAGEQLAGFDAGMPLFAFAPAILLSNDTIVAAEALEADEIKHIQAYSLEGEKLWDSKFSGSFVLDMQEAQDGTLYVLSQDSALQVFSPTGERIWSFEGPNRELCSARNHSLTIGPDSVAYVGAWDQLYALSSDGTLRWQWGNGDTVNRTMLSGNGTILCVLEGEFDRDSGLLGELAYQLRDKFSRQDAVLPQVVSTLVALSAEGKEQQRWKLPEAAGHPAWSGSPGRLLGSSWNQFYCLEPDPPLP